MSKKSSRRRRDEQFHRRTPPGAAPGLVMVDPEAPRPTIRAITYGPEKLEIRDEPSLADLRSCLQTQLVTWVDVDGLGDIEAILGIGEVFGLHQLALEDVVHVHQRPKVEHYEHFQFIVARMPVAETHFSTEQLSLFLGRNFVVTFQEGIPGDCFDEVRRRLQESTFRIRRLGADYLAYAILDALVDSYFPLLEAYGQRLEVLEDDVLTTPDRSTILELQAIKRDLLSMRRVFWPMREAMGSMLKDPSSLIQEETRLFLRDCHDHTVQLLDLLETYREIAGGLVDLYLSSVSHRMNEVMKVLTIISTLFIPLSFIAGVYGMNFDPDMSPYNMPELHWAFGYPFAICLMLTVAVGLLLWLYHKGWLSGEEPLPTATVRDQAAGALEVPPPGGTPGS